MKRPEKPEPLTLAEALIAVASLIGLVALSYFLFGDAGAHGPSQVALTVATMIVAFMGWRRGHSLDSLRRGRHRQRELGDRRDLHPARGRRADRDLGDERHAGDHGPLRPAAPASQLFLRDRGHHLRGHLCQHRQLVDGGRHDRHRPDGHFAEHGPGSRRSPRPRSSRAPTSATRPRRCRTPSTWPRPRPAAISTSTSARRR